MARYDTHDPYYVKQMTRLCLYAKEHHIPLEFNLLGYQTHRHYPSEDFFKIVKEVGNQVVIGTDAHESRSLLNQAVYQSAQQFLSFLDIETTEEIKFLR